MTAKAGKKSATSTVETLDNGTIVITEGMKQLAADLEITDDELEGAADDALKMGMALAAQNREDSDAIKASKGALEKPKPKVKPGHEDFDWKTEYPDEDDVYVFTSSEGLTIGLAKLGPKRKPKPGLLRRLHREGGMSVMWYFIELASSDASLKLQEELEEQDYTSMLRGWAEFAGIELSE